MKQIETNVTLRITAIHNTPQNKGDNVTLNYCDFHVFMCTPRKMCILLLVDIYISFHCYLYWEFFTVHIWLKRRSNSIEKLINE